MNSKEGIRFRRWATEVLKEHIIKGYTLKEKRLAELGIKELEQSIKLLQKTLVNHHLVDDIGAESIQLIMSYAKTWHVLLAYDEYKLELPRKGQPAESALTYKMARAAIEAFKVDLAARNEVTTLFGHEREQGLDSILGNIEQTFDERALYKNTEERAAHVLYFIIKDHPFSDGNKRIGCLMFLLYLKLQKSTTKINDNGLIALALLIAESDPTQKHLMIKLIVNLLLD